jgi:hypothetical protein
MDKHLQPIPRKYPTFMTKEAVYDYASKPNLLNENNSAPLQNPVHDHGSFIRSLPFVPKRRPIEL